MKKAIVFVEGDYDFRIMSKIVSNETLVVRGAGKNGQSSFIQGYAESKGATTSDVLIGFRDRDFDRPIPENCTLEIDKNIAFSYRRTIENYLLRPESFALFFENDRSRKFSMLNLDLISNLMIESARELRFYQAGRQALGEVRKRNNLGTTWTAKSGSIPSQLDEKYCLEKGKELLTIYAHEAAQIADLNQFENLYNEYSAIFDDAFYEKRLHEVWFQGKDLEKVLQSKLQKHVASFPMKTLYNLAIENFNIEEFQDLMEFTSWISEKTQSS